MKKIALMVLSVASLAAFCAPVAPVTPRVATNISEHVSTRVALQTVSNMVTRAFVERLGITSEEIDPTVPQWAKAPIKPTYTASEVGATSPTAVSNIVTTAYVREKLGVYLYVGDDGGIYVHTNEE